MKIGVLLKIVPDTETKIRIKDDQSGIDETAEINYIINPYDEYAIEEAIKLKESLNEAEIITISAGPKEFDPKPIRKAMAMGTDKAVYIADDAFKSDDSFLTAKTLAKALEQESFDIIFAGKQAMDYDNSQVPQILASLLNISCITDVSKFEFKNGEKKAIVERETEGGTKEKWELTTPCIVGATKGLNEPRYPALPKIMQAKKKELKIIALADLGINTTQIKTEIKKYSLPPQRTTGKILTGDEVETAKQLVKLLREEAKAI